MSPLVRKEVRSILPAWIAALVLAILPVWIVWPGAHGAMIESLGLVVFAPFGLGVLLLSLAPFGQELSWGTLPVLLSQPVSRRRLWLVKTTVLAAALCAAFVALLISNHIRVDSMLENMKHTAWRNAFERPGEQGQFFLRLISQTRREASQDTLLIGGLAVLAGFAGGLWTTLLVRQVAAAFWLTLLVPMGLVLLTGKILGNFPGNVGQWGLFAVLASYSAAGVIWAKRLFVQAQDTQWTGGNVSLPVWGAIAAGAARGGSRKKKVLRGLLRKEFQAQHVNLLLAGGLLLVHLALIGFRKLSPGYLAAHRSLAMSLDGFPILWLAMPLLIGSVSVAEERKLGTLASALCLPASRRVQFLSKLALAMALGLVCGGILPLLVEQLALSFGLHQSPAGLFFLGDIRSSVFVQLFGAAGITALALYGSTLARNTLQAMGAGFVATAIACLLIVGAGQVATVSEIILWRGRLLGLIGWPVMTLVILTLAYRNYRQLQPDFKTVAKNGLWVLLALLGTAILTSFVYHRAWEVWLPEEPVHRFNASIYPSQSQQSHAGFALPKRAVSAAKIQASASQTAVLLPRGRLWLRQAQARMLQQQQRLRGLVCSFGVGPSHTGFVAGSDWKDVAVTWDQCFGIKVDGSLWDLSPTRAGEFTVRRVDQNGDWDSISAGLGHFCARKTDGTIWQWGRRVVGIVSVGEALAPTRVGNDADWTIACCGWDASAAIKTDGSIWRWNFASAKHTRPELWLSGSCAQPVSMTMIGDALAYVCPDGTLWLGCDLTNSFYNRLIGPDKVQRATHDMVRWGTDTEWREIHFVGWGKAAGIMRDDTLWVWNMDQVSFQPYTGWAVSPTMPSRYMDWIALGSNDNAFLALARDGSLCLWGDPEGRPYEDWIGSDPEAGSGFEPRRLLMPSLIKARRIAELSR